MNQDHDANAIETPPAPDSVQAVANPRKSSQLKDRLDLLVAVCALLTSVTSIWLSISQGDDMARLVQAQSWPHIGFSTANAEWNPTSASWDDRIILAIANAGVGPAKIRAIKMRFDGVDIKSSAELLARCCQAPARVKLGSNNAPLITSSSVGTVLRAGQNIELLNWLRPEPSVDSESKAQAEVARQVWQALDANRGRIQLEVCYCSVFDECWTLLPNTETVPTAACPTDRDSFYME